MKSKRTYKIPDILKIYHFNNTKFYTYFSIDRYKVMHKPIFEKYYIAAKELPRKKIIISLTWLILALILCIPFALFLSNTTPYLEHRNGIVKNDMVKYVQGTVKYIALSDLGLSSDDVSDGENITLYFNEDEIASVKTAKDEQKQDKPLFIGIVFLCFITPVAVGVIRYSGVGKYTFEKLATSTYKFEQIDSKIKMERLCAYMFGDDTLYQPDLQPLYLGYVIEYKSYKNRVTHIKCRIYNPNKGKYKKKKIWVLNEDPLYETIITKKQDNG